MMSSMNDTRHSFAVCAYGQSEYLDSCVASVLNQEIPSNVYITTATPNRHIEDVARKYDVPLFVSEKKPGIASDWNFALSQCETSLVTLAHQDDVYLPRYSLRVMEYASKYTDMIIFFSNYGEIRNGFNVDDGRLLRVKRRLLAPLKERRFAHSKFMRRRLLSLGSAICCPSVVFNLNRLSLPVFETSFKCDLDWDEWEKLSLLDGSFVYCPEILMRHRIHEESETSNLILDNTRTQEDLEMLKRFWPTPFAHIINFFYSASQNSNNL